MPEGGPPPLRPAASREAIAEAAAALRAGRLVAFPTETVYGLGADAACPRALAALFAAKGRPSANPLIVHVASVAEAERLAVFSEAARRLAAAFWPGPLTLVLPSRPGSPVAPAARAGLPTVALRAPSHPAARALLRAAGVPLAGPSANRSGRPSATEARHVLDDLGAEPALALVLDGGPCAGGIESTVLSLPADAGAPSEEGATANAAPQAPPQALLLRRGAVGVEALCAAAPGLSVREPGRGEERAGRPLAPGRGFAHYRPSAPLRLDARSVAADEAWLGFGPGAPPGRPAASFNLSPSGDPAEAASRLFSALRLLERSGARAIAAAPTPRGGAVAEALRDRMERAASPSPKEGGG